MCFWSVTCRAGSGPGISRHQLALLSCQEVVFFLLCPGGQPCVSAPPAGQVELFTSCVAQRGVEVLAEGGGGLFLVRLMPVFIPISLLLLLLQELGVGCMALLSRYRGPFLPRPHRDLLFRQPSSGIAASSGGCQCRGPPTPLLCLSPWSCLGEDKG